MNKIRLLLTSLVLAFPSVSLGEHQERYFRPLTATAPELSLAGALAATVVVILGFLYLRQRRAARQGN